jgi:hypothetical protein
MHRTLATLALIILASLPARADCGEWRADVKLGGDDHARRVDLTPRDVTVADLTALEPPTHPSPVRDAAELRVYRVRAVVVAYRLEADGDFHVVLSDGRRTMVVEIPDPKRAERGPWARQIAAAREYFADAYHPSRRLRHASSKVVVEGVGFFDKIHGQVGAAANGFELHPVLSIRADDN